MSRITCTSASARAISALPAASSGRDVRADLIAVRTYGTVPMVDVTIVGGEPRYAAGLPVGALVAAGVPV